MVASHWVEEDDEVKDGRPGMITAHFQVPDHVSSAAEVDLLFDGVAGVGALLLKVPGEADLRAPIRHTIDDANMRAAFRKKKKILSVSIPVLKVASTKRKIQVVEDDEDEDEVLEIAVPPLRATAAGQTSRSLSSQGPLNANSRANAFSKASPSMAMSLESDSDDSESDAQKESSQSVASVVDVLKRLQTQETPVKFDKASNKEFKEQLDALKSSLSSVEKLPDATSKELKQTLDALRASIPQPPKLPEDPEQTLGKLKSSLSSPAATAPATLVSKETLEKVKASVPAPVHAESPEDTLKKLKSALPNANAALARASDSKETLEKFKASVPDARVQVPEEPEKILEQLMSAVPATVKAPDKQAWEKFDSNVADLKKSISGAGANGAGGRGVGGGKDIKNVQSNVKEEVADAAAADASARHPQISKDAYKELLTKIQDKVPREKLEHWAEELKAAGVRANAPGLSAFARSEEQAAGGKGGEDKAEGKRLKEEGNALVKAGRHAEARAKYSASIAAWKHDPASYSNRALCAFKAGEMDKAISDCLDGLVVDPTFPRLHERLGDFAVHRKRFREAVKHYRQGLELAPEHQGSLPRFPAASASATGGAAACPISTGCTLGLKDALKKLQEERAPKPAAAAEALAASGIGAHVEVKEAPGRGRCVFATEALALGAEVVRSEPMCCVVTDKYAESHCHGCFQPLAGRLTPPTRSSYMCAKSCGGVLYCSTSCQQRDEPQHDGECDVLAAWTSQPTKLQKSTRGLRMFVRLVTAIHRDARAAAALEALEKAPGAERHKGLLGMAGAVNRFVREEARLPPERLATFISSTQRNMHAVVNLAGNALGHGLYPKASLFNHSCRPNCVVSFDGPVLVVRAIQPVKAGEELTIAYVELYAPREVRRQELREKKGFYCTCWRCETDTAGEIAIVEGDPSCAGHARDAFEAALKLYQAGEYSGASRVLDQVLRELNDRLGPHNWIRYDMHKLLGDCALAVKDSAATIKHFKAVLKCMAVQLPVNHPSVALATMHVAEATLRSASSKGLERRQEQAKEASRLYRQAVRVLTITYGEDHSETRRAVQALNAADLIATPV